MSEVKHTPGPWRWEFNRKHKSVKLVGGKPMYDLTIIEPTRWGLNNAGFMIRDTAHDGMNIMHKLNERDDWIAPFEGRKHHEDWCADVIHPDMRLMAAAPELLDALQLMLVQFTKIPCTLKDSDARVKAHIAITKATGANP